MGGRSRGKGGNKRKKGKNFLQDKRELLFQEDGQVYGQVTKLLGNSRIQVMCLDEKEWLCHIWGKMKNRVWIAVGDLVLVSNREFEADKGDIIHKYMPDEVKELKKHGEIPESLEITDHEG